MNWIWLGILSVLTLASWFAPYLMRRDLLFGVTVSPEFRDTAAARDIIRRYRMLVFAVGTAGLCIVNFIWSRNQHPGALWAIVPLWIFAGNAIAFAHAHKAAKAFSSPGTSIREVELLPISRGSVEHPPMLFVGPAILALGFLFAFSTPEKSGQVPLLAGWQAVVARWNAIDSLVSRPLSLTLGACLGALIPLLAFRFGTRRSPAGLTNYRRIMLRNIILLNAAFAALAVFVMGMGALGKPIGKIEVGAGMAVILAGLVAHLAYIVALRRKENMTLATASGHPLGDRTPDESWLWGMFYRNPNDPALFVEARTGPGYTVNFGHVRGWLIVAGFLTLIILPLLLI